MGINCDHLANKVPAGTTKLSQGDLKIFCLADCMGIKQIVNSLISGDKGQAVD